ncbi:uncharacterized protein LOC127000271 [Eriocheir sinensis]|uniref:uncharacterized protein LOC127000271 n=1 Tax=Eriocheir sinensis TaxID=95602 RepID=UPI0021C86B26|nr:uncharacterized protein LOC127000271 [Eriocheir sinensis]
MVHITASYYSWVQWHGPCQQRWCISQPHITAGYSGTAPVSRDGAYHSLISQLGTVARPLSAEMVHITASYYSWVQWHGPCQQGWCISQPHITAGYSARPLLFASPGADGRGVLGAAVVVLAAAPSAEEERSLAALMSPSLRCCWVQHGAATPGPDGLGDANGCVHPNIVKRSKR